MNLPCQVLLTKSCKKVLDFCIKDLATDADMQDISIDSTCIKAHKSSAGAKKEKS